MAGYYKRTQTGKAPLNLVRRRAAAVLGKE